MNQHPSKTLGWGTYLDRINCVVRKKTGAIIAHGTANDMNNSLIVTVADGLAAAGYTSLRFNFPYKEKDETDE